MASRTTAPETALGTYEGRPIEIAQLSAGGWKIPVEAPFHRDDDVILLVRIRVANVTYGEDKSERPCRFHTSAIKQVGIVPEDQTTALAEVLQRAVDDREGKAGLEFEDDDDG